MQHGTGFERSPDDDFHAYCLCFAHSCACIAGSAHGTALWKEVHSSSLLMGLYPDNLYMVGFYHNRHRLYLGYYFKRRACSGRTSGNLSLLPFQSEGLFTYLTNIVMFMPLGFLLPYIWKNYRSLAKTALTGFLAAAFVSCSASG